MHTLFGITLVLYLLKLSAGKGFNIYHIAHFLTGFILEPTGQRYALENSTELRSGPVTLQSKKLTLTTTFRKYKIKQIPKIDILYS